MSWNFNESTEWELNHLLNQDLVDDLSGEVVDAITGNESFWNEMIGHLQQGRNVKWVAEDMLEEMGMDWLIGNPWIDWGLVELGMRAEMPLLTREVAR